MTGTIKVLAKGTPSWETNTARPRPIPLGAAQPVETPVNAGLAGTSDSDDNFNPTPTFGQVACPAHFISLSFEDNKLIMMFDDNYDPPSSLRS